MKFKWTADHSHDEYLLWVGDNLVGDVRRVRNGNTYGMIWRATYGQYGQNPDQYFNFSLEACKNWLKEQVQSVYA